MSIEQQLSEMEALRERLRALEAAAARPSGFTNIVGAARFLGRSQEWLRKEHIAGRGPPRRRNGTRNWSYSFADLTAWAKAQGGE
jgi:hypothetical protein